MTIKEYFNSLPNRISANIFALLGFVNFIIVLYTFNQSLFWTGSASLFLNYLFSCILFVYTVVIFFPILIPYFFLLKNNKKKKSSIFLLIMFVIFCTLFTIVVKVLHSYLSTFWGLVAIYNDYFPLIFLFLLLILFFYIYDVRKNIKIKNIILIENRAYRIVLKIFYIYFMFQYIPFLILSLMLLICSSFVYILSFVSHFKI